MSARLIVFICTMMGAYTFCIGAFPVLLPEVDRAFDFSDRQLGAIAGAFGFARMVTDIPAGLLVTHHPRRALIGGPVFMLLGVLTISGARGFAWLVVGQALLSIGYTLSNLASVTVILRLRAASGLASTLNVYEFSAMIAILGAVTLIGLLPAALPWNIVFLIGCTPLLVGVVALQGVLRDLEPTPARPWFARVQAEASPARSGNVMLVTLAFGVGAAVAVTYGTVASFLIPLRGSRDFGLDRAGIAQLFMLAQVCDIVALLPLGGLADRRGAPRVLAAVIVTLAAAVGLIAFGAMPHAIVGCVLFGLGMSGWMLPLGLLRSATPASQISWRTALYRVWVDGGMFIGPFLSGLLAVTHPGLLPGILVIALMVLASVLFVARRAWGPT